MSQGKGGKAATVKGKEEAPAAPQSAPEVPPQPRDATRAEKEEIVYLNLSELFASVNFGGVVVDDFKVVNGQNGVFLGAPSKPDPTSRSGYRATVRINDRATQERLNAAGVQAYNMAVEKLLARAEAVRPAPIREQMDKAGKEAAQKNAARSAPAKGKEGRDGR